MPAAAPKISKVADAGITGVTAPDLPLPVQPEAAANNRVGEIRSFPKQKGAVRTVCFSPDGVMVASAGADGKVRLWNVERAKEVRHFDDCQQPVLALTFSGDGQWLAAVTGPAEGGKGSDAAEPSKLFVWKVAGGPPVISGPLDASFSATDVKFSPQKQLLALAGRDGTVRLYDLGQKRETDKLKKHSGPIWCLAFSPDGKLLASGGEDRSVWVWSVDPANPVREFVGHQGPVTAVTFTSDSRQVVSGSKDKSVLVWSLEKDKPENRFEGLESAVTCLTCSAGGQCVVAGDAGGLLRLFQPVKGRPLERFSGHEGAVLHLDRRRRAAAWYRPGPTARCASLGPARSALDRGRRAEGAGGQAAGRGDEAGGPQPVRPQEGRGSPQGRAAERRLRCGRSALAEDVRWPASSSNRATRPATRWARRRAGAGPGPGQRVGRHGGGLCGHRRHGPEVRPRPDGGQGGRARRVAQGQGGERGGQPGAVGRADTGPGPRRWRPRNPTRPSGCC